MSDNTLLVEVTGDDPLWELVLDVAERLPTGMWVLVGGAMTRAYAQSAGIESRMTKDMDVLIDVMSDTRSVGKVYRVLSSLGFVEQEPLFRNGPIHRMLDHDGREIDILVADHLPSGKRRAAAISSGKPVFEAPGASRAVECKRDIIVRRGDRFARFEVPDLFGAVLLKASAYQSDNRRPHRHLEDAALLLSLMEDPFAYAGRFKGHDASRIDAISEALADKNESAWLLLPPAMAERGRASLAILDALSHGLR